MKNFIKRTLSDDFLKNNIIFLAGSLAVSFFNYAYHPILGRMLSLEDFGELQAIISLFTQITIVTSVFGIIVINTVSNQKDKKITRYIMTELQRVALLITFLLFGAIVLFSKQLESVLQFKSLTPFLMLALLLPLGTTLGFRSAFLQGDHKFKEVSYINILSSFMKLLAAIVLVYFGFRTTGAIAGLVIAQVIAIVYAINISKKDLPMMSKIPFFPTKNHKNENIEIKDELKYGVFIFLMLYSITFLYTADILVIKGFFDPTVSGLYGGVSTIARIIFFVTASVAGVLLPSIKLDDKSGNNQKILKKSIMIVLVISLPAFVVFYLFPTLIITVLLGSKFVSFAPYLSLLSLSIIITSVINLFIYYFIALRRYATAVFPVAGLLLFLLLSSTNHAKVTSIIYDLIFSNIAVLAMLLGYYFFKERRLHGK